jgi:hypothetical protein
MDKQFFSQNNYIALKEIISSVAGISFNTKDDERKLYEHMVHTYDTTKTDNFHDLNKKCISIYTDRFERQIPTNNELNNQQSNGNIINPVQSSIQSNTIKPISLDNESSDIESIIEEENPMDLFAKLKQERSNAYEIQSSKQNYERPVNSIQSDLEETFQNGQDLNQFHDIDRSTHNFNSDNLMNPNNNENKFDGVIQNSIDKMNDNDEKMNKKQIIAEENNTFTTLNPYSYFQQGPQNKQSSKLIQRETIIIIDSKDRDLELYPNTNNYQVKFGGNSDTIEIPTHLNENGVIVHETATLYKGYQGANINMVLKNIKYIQLVNVTVPYTPVYYNGNPPVTYTDENQSKNTTNDLLAEAYLPKFKKGTGSIIKPNSTGGTGIPLDILDEPYLLIHIDEIDTDSWYRSTNPETDGAFARVMNPSIISSHTNAPFAIFEPQTIDERMTYEPTLLSSLDKMTLHIKDLSNNHIDVGQDKMYVEIIEQSDGDIINKCFADTSQTSPGTDITITPEHNDYISEGCNNNKINNHNLKPGDTVYFYDTKPCNNEHIYKLNKEQTHIKYDSGTFEIKYKYNTTTKNNKSITERTLSLSQYLFIGDFISVSGNLFKIINFQGKKAQIHSEDIAKYNVFLTTNLTNFTNNFEVGFVRQNKKGFTSDNRCALNSKRGHKVVYIYQNGTTGTSNKFTIDLPFEKIERNYSNYIKESVFFIKKKLQTSYMFKISTMHKQNEQFESELV